MRLKWQELLSENPLAYQESKIITCHPDLFVCPLSTSFMKIIDGQMNMCQTDKTQAKKIILPHITHVSIVTV